MVAMAMAEHCIYSIGLSLNLVEGTKQIPW